MRRPTRRSSASAGERGSLLQFLARRQVNPRAFADVRGSLLQSPTRRQVNPSEAALEYPYVGEWRSDGTIPNSGVLANRQDSKWDGHPLVLSFRKERGNKHDVAIADNSGNVGIYSTRFPFPGMNFSRENPWRHGRIGQWVAHDEMISDISWIKEDTCMLTCSKANTIKLWDIERTTQVGEMLGHTDGVRSLSVNPTQPGTFVSGSSDGSIIIWDTRDRAQREHTFYYPVEKKAVYKTEVFKNTVTAVLYLKDGQLIASGRSALGVVSYWDTRMLTAPVTQTPHEVAEGYIWRDDVPHARDKGLSGIASLSEDPTGTRLIAACADDTIYMYDAIRPERGAVRTFTGHLAGNFFIKASFSPDGSHVLSGSEDNDAYIWKVNDRNGRPARLKGHARGVAAVSWCRADLCDKVATSSFDNSVRIWSLKDSESDDE